MLANSGIYSVILCIVILSLLVVLILGIVFGIKCLKIKRWLKNNKGKKPSAVLKKNRNILKQTKKKIKACVVLWVIVSLLLTVFNTVKQKVYAMSEHYIWSEEERGINAEEENHSLTFEVVMREYGEWWWKEAICFEWSIGTICDGNGNYIGDITAESIDYYYNKIIAESIEDGKSKNEIAISTEKPESFENDLELFATVVGMEDAEITMLWKGYEAGKRVQQYNNTSENVFQTGVLPEKIHFRTCKGGSTDDRTIVYLAAEFEQFDLFLSFEKLYIGEKTEVSKEDVFFRKAKSSYNEGRYGLQEEGVKIHCVLMAYAFFSYLADKTEKTDPNYLLYTYYSGHAFLYIMSEIKDEVCREGLCMKELRRWDGLVINGSGYEIEGLEEENILGVKEGLELAIGRE